MRTKEIFSKINASNDRVDIEKLKINNPPVLTPIKQEYSFKFRLLLKRLIFSF